eukprot:scaffold258604_cov17-Tisochrysis_lutea.AAC.1
MRSCKMQAAPLSCTVPPMCAGFIPKNSIQMTDRNSTTAGCAHLDLHGVAHVRSFQCNGFHPME